MNKLAQLYRFINLLSIDVAIGAVCSALFFARLLNVHILPFGLIALGLSVWIIYCVDHLIDAAKVKGEASTARHRFHQKHFSLLVKLVVMLTIVNAVLVFYIRKPVFIGGMVLMLVVVIYLVLHRWLRLPKEFLIALLYTGGVLLPSISVTAIPVAQWPWLLITPFMLTALLNLILFSWFDLENDLRDGNDSFVTVAGEKFTRILIWIISGVNVVLSFSIQLSSAAIILLVMNLVLLIIFLLHRKTSMNDRYRLFGDAIFLLPIIELLIHP